MSTILVVDDSLFMRKLICSIVVRAGFTVAGEAGSGFECIQKYQEYKPDLVTLDVTMADMDGIQILKNILKIDRKAKVIMISAMGQESVIKNAILAGAKGFIVKPFKERHIMAIFDKVLMMKR